MKKITGILCLFVFLSPFVLLIGGMVIATITPMLQNIQSILWFLGISLIFILWLMSGHYGLKYLHSKIGTAND